MSATHRLAIRVYYEDTDFSGVVYHANYLRYLERARTEWLRDLGVDQVALLAGRDGRPPAAFAVRAMTLGFRAPARMDDMLEVVSFAAEIGGASALVRQCVLRGDAVLLEADVRIALVSGGRPARFPRDLAAKLAGAVTRS